MRLRELMVIVAIVALTLAGCSEEEPGTANGPPNSSPGGSTETDPPATSSSRPGGSGGGSAPKVDNALDASRLVGQPCAAIAATQLQQLGLPAEGKPDTDSQVAKTVGPTCTWSNRDSGSSLGFGLLTGNKNGLSDIYRTKSRYKGYFEPTEVDGYPAVFADLDDNRGDGVCDLTVGVSDALAFRVGVLDSQLGQGSCDRAQQAAAAVITTLK